MINNFKSSLVGPLHADSFVDKEDFINNYVSLKGENSIYKDPLLGSVINGEKIILSGVRGTGKTMILKTGEAILKQLLKKDIKNDNDKEIILPVYVTYSGFKKDVSLQHKLELNSEDLKIAREVFRGYFYMMLLERILKNIEEMNLDKSVSFNLFGIRTKLGIKREVEEAIKTFKRLGFREIIESKQKGIDIDLKIKSFGINSGGSSQEDITEIRLDDMQKTNLFKETIESICSVYNIDKIHYLFDEVYYLKYLQPEFFDILFGFRNFTNITFSISSYPTFMDYGKEFDIPDDAREVSVSSSLYKPDKDNFEKPLEKLVESRIESYAKKSYQNVISNDALEHLILLTNGNPRMLLQAIDYISQQNNGSQINLHNITQDLIFYMVKNWYLKFMKSQAKRYKTSIDKIEEFINVIVNRLKKNNERNEVPTIFFLIDDEIYKHFNSTISLLHYSRIIDAYKIGDFGGSGLKKGQTYLLNPMVGIYYGIFSKKQISKLSSLIKNSISKDRKIQFGSLDYLLKKFNNSDSITCPRYIDGECIDAKCKDTYSEEWTSCPFHQGMSLEPSHSKIYDVEIDVLNLSDNMKRRINDADINTLFDIMDKGITGLMEAEYVGEVRASNIYYTTREYIDDNY